MTPSRLIRTPATLPFSVALACAVVLAGPAALAADTKAASAQHPARQTGEEWDVTAQMSMEGMEGFAMPAQKSRVCAAREWTRPPVLEDDRLKCETFDFRATGTKATWKIRCAGPPAMTGEGEVDRTSPDAYSGWMKMTSKEGVMTMKMSGRKVGECDAVEARRQDARVIAQAEAQAADAQAQAVDAQDAACRQMAASMDMATLRMPGMPCTDPKYKAVFCDSLQTVEGYTLAAAPNKAPGYGLQEAGAYCDVDLVENKKKLCREALEKELLDFLGKECPEEAQRLAERECAGRDFSALQGTKYQGFCTTYAREMLAKGGKPAEAEAKPESKKDKAKKLFKGLLP